MKCPFCAETIKDDAIICRYCKRKLKRSDTWRKVRLSLLIVVLLLIAKSYGTIRDVAVSLSGSIDDIALKLSEIMENINTGYGALERNQTGSFLNSLPEMKGVRNEKE